MPHANLDSSDENQAERLPQLMSNSSAASTDSICRQRQRPSSLLVNLTQAFYLSGGVVTADAFCTAFAQKHRQPISQVARWIVNRDVVSFVADSRAWLPIFQFDLATLQVTQPGRQVVSELRDVYDDQDLAEWFATPNSWLGEETPAIALALHANAVLAAARADRFTAAG